MITRCWLLTQSETSPNFSLEKQIPCVFPEEVLVSGAKFTSSIAKIIFPWRRCTHIRMGLLLALPTSAPPGLNPLASILILSLQNTDMEYKGNREAKRQTLTQPPEYNTYTDKKVQPLNTEYIDKSVLMDVLCLEGIISVCHGIFTDKHELRSTKGNILQDGTTVSGSGERGAGHSWWSRI